MKFLNFENWSSGELSKLEMIFESKMILQLSYQKLSIKKCATKLVLFNEKKSERFQMIFEVENQILALFDTSPLHQYTKLISIEYI